MAIIFITGIDTHIGKTYVTGLLGAYLKRNGYKVTTAKLVQTGSQPISEDIIFHRRIMEEPLSKWDQEGVTCPYVFSFPASPHLAAQNSGIIINPDTILRELARIQLDYEIVLVEGAGGLRVPLNSRLTILDLVAQETWPCLLATSSRLGSVNHTWLSIDSLKSINAPILGIAYTDDPAANRAIAKDTLSLFRQQWPEIPTVSIPWLKTAEKINIPDFSVLQL